MKPWLTQEKSLLSHQFEEQTLPHAMLITGVKGSGKKELSQWLSNKLLCKTLTNTNNAIPEQQNAFESEVENSDACGYCKSCNLFKQQTHPDFTFIELTGNSIGVDQIRQVSRFFEKTAQLGLNQVVIIEEADAMTESAANALLKTLEEPTNNSFIILLVNDQQRLLPTLISRCRHIALKPHIGESLRDYSGVESNDPFLNLSYLHEVTDENINEQYNSLLKVYVNFLLNNQSRMELLSLITQNKESLKWLERITINLIRQENDWLTSSNIGLEEEQLSTFLAENKEAIWKVYLLIKRYTKQSLTLSQLNPEFMFEKFLVEVMKITQGCQVS